MFARLCKSLLSHSQSLSPRTRYSTAPGNPLQKVVRENLDKVKLAGIFKEELSFSGPQAAVISKSFLLADLCTDQQDMDVAWRLVAGDSAKFGSCWVLLNRGRGWR